MTIRNYASRDKGVRQRICRVHLKGWLGVLKAKVKGTLKFLFWNYRGELVSGSLEVLVVPGLGATINNVFQLRGCAKKALWRICYLHLLFCATTTTRFQYRWKCWECMFLIRWSKKRWSPRAYFTRLRMHAYNITGWNRVTPVRWVN